MLSVVELLQELIRFDTTNPPGNEAACIAFVQGLLEEEGLETQILEQEPGRPNLGSRLPGGGAQPLLLQGHVDVVTTAGQTWTHPPFEGRLEDGYVWGRGALDMKAGVAMLVHAFLRAKREGAELPGDVVLLVLADEENGGNLGARFLVQEHAELFEGMRYALGEFGGFTLTIAGKRFYPIQVAEKQICWLKATIRGPGGHGALVQRGGTVARLGKLLRDLDRKRMPVHVTPVVREFVDRIAAELPRKEATVMRSLLKPRLTDTALRLLGERGTTMEPMLRNTVNATIVRGGAKINVVPSEIELELDGRALPGFTPEQVIAELPRKEATVMRSLLKPRLTDTALRLLGERGSTMEPMLRNTVNATIVRGGAKINVVPSEIELELDGRALPGFTPEQMIAELHELVGDDVEIELVRHDPGPAAPDLGLFETLAGVIRELDPDGIPVPFLQIGVTDGRFFSQAGVQTYGFLPMRLPEDFQFAKLIHAADERIPVEALEFGAEAVWRAIQRFH